MSGWNRCTHDTITTPTIRQFARADFHQSQSSMHCRVLPVIVFLLFNSSETWQKQFKQATFSVFRFCIFALHLLTIVFVFWESCDHFVFFACRYHVTRKHSSNSSTQIFLMGARVREIYFNESELNYLLL